MYMNLRKEQAVYWSTICLQSAIPSFFGSYIVLGHTSTGTNWLCNLLSDYYGVSVLDPWNRSFPSFSKHVFHMHRFAFFLGSAKNLVYLHRDGRDVMVSLFFKIARSPTLASFRNDFSSFSGELMNANKAHEQLPQFIDWHFNSKQPGSVNWRIHVKEAIRRGYLHTRYESLKSDTYTELSRIIQTFDRTDFDAERLDRAISKNVITKQEIESHGYQVRSGEIGDWESYFSQEACKRFSFYANDELIQLGYETSKNWRRQRSF